MRHTHSHTAHAHNMRHMHDRYKRIPNTRQVHRTQTTHIQHILSTQATLAKHQTQHLSTHTQQMHIVNNTYKILPQTIGDITHNTFAKMTPCTHHMNNTYTAHVLFATHGIYPSHFQHMYRICYTWITHSRHERNPHSTACTTCVHHIPSQYRTRAQHMYNTCITYQNLGHIHGIRATQTRHISHAMAHLLPMQNCLCVKQCAAYVMYACHECVVCDVMYG